jgi:hypothetical protein
MTQFTNQLFKIKVKVKNTNNLKQTIILIWKKIKIYIWVMSPKAFLAYFSNFS